MKARFGELVHEARRRAELSLRELAAQSGIDYTRLYRIERGERPAPPLPHIRKLAEILDLSIGDLLVSAGTPREVVEELLWQERLRPQEMHVLSETRVAAEPALLEKNTYAVRMISRDGALCRVRLGEAELTVLSFSAEDELVIVIPPELISVRAKPGSPGEETVDNAVSAHVLKVRNTGQLTDLVLEADGFELNALVTRQSAEAMQLAPGMDVVAVFSATCVRTRPRERRGS